MLGCTYRSHSAYSSGISWFGIGLVKNVTTSFNRSFSVRFLRFCSSGPFPMIYRWASCISSLILFIASRRYKSPLYLCSRAVVSIRKPPSPPVRYLPSDCIGLNNSVSTPTCMTLISRLTPSSPIMNSLAAVQCAVRISAPSRSFLLTVASSTERAYRFTLLSG